MVPETSLDCSNHCTPRVATSASVAREVTHLGLTNAPEPGRCRAGFRGDPLADPRRDARDRHVIRLDSGASRIVRAGARRRCRRHHCCLVEIRQFHFQFRPRQREVRPHRPLAQSDHRRDLAVLELLDQMRRATMRCISGSDSMALSMRAADLVRAGRQVRRVAARRRLGRRSALPAGRAADV